MTLAPIRGAPPSAPIPDFPVDEPRTKPATTPASDDQPPTSPIRRRYMPIEIVDGGVVLTFRVIPELPAIARASMTIDIVAETAGQSLGSLRMSAASARAFLTDLRDGCSPLVATGDEGGTVQVEFDITEAGVGLSVREPGERDASHRWVIDRRVDWKTAANELLADLGA